MIWLCLFKLIKKILGCENSHVAVVDEECLNSDEEVQYTDAAIVQFINIPV